MSDGDALLRAILEQPDEDTPRLVYADWLQENGDDLQAEFIRWQCRGKIRHPFPRVSYRKWFRPWWAGQTCRRTVWSSGPLHLLMKVRGPGEADSHQMYVRRGFVGEVKSRLPPGSPMPPQSSPPSPSCGSGSATADPRQDRT